MKTNVKTKAAPVYTHEGARVVRTNPYNELRRSTMACMLWEDSFYESGESIASRIAGLVKTVGAADVMKLAVEARSKMNMRHAPLLLLRELARRKDASAAVEAGLVECIQRPDELAEFLAIYWKDKKQPLAACVKRGLARAFTKFTPYQFAKYNADRDIKLRDVMFLVHPKPVDKEQEDTFKALADNKLSAPDTWEVQLSGGANKKATFERLISEGKLGALALIRNLRLMTENGVDEGMIRSAIVNAKTDRVLPFRFIAAARHAPRFEPQLEWAMFKCLEGSEMLSGKTLLLVDVSGSMTSNISGKTQMSRIDAACGLAILLREVCENVDVYTFASQEKYVPPRRGFALRDAIMAQFGGSTRLGTSLSHLNYGEGHDRVIVITDGQSEDSVGAPRSKRGYILNVAAYQNGVGYGPWLSIDGWSDACVKYIQAYEGME